MKYWPESVEKCANCGCDTERRDYGRRGYCCRCYRLVRRIKKIKGWDREYLENLKRSRGFSEEEAKIWQDECIRQLDGHLGWIHGREHQYQGSVKGIDIEHQLGRILRMVRPKANYPRHASIFDYNFSKEQQVLIYHMLDVIEEAIPWEGPRRGATILYGRVWEKIHEHREETGVYPASGALSPDKE